MLLVPDEQAKVIQHLGCGQQIIATEADRILPFVLV
jgi:hypothetical protein